MLSEPPKYRYPLYEEWDKKCYGLISELASKRQNLKIVGKKEDINEFLKLLIRSQKMDDWRKFLKVVLDEISKGELNIPKILTTNIELKKGYGRWVVFREDREISDFLDDLERKKIQFIGNDKEVSEFVLRFILAQLSMDWKGSLYAIKETIESKTRVKIAELNAILSEFDYTKVFEN